MNLVYRKIAMLEKDFIAREECAKFEGYSTKPIDTDLKNRVTRLLDQVRYI